ncbi:MAG: pyruvate kinase [Streptosporangiaceae bacterium]
MTRRAKIVCTLGPATSGSDHIRALADAGMDVARLNMSHGTRDEHREVYLRVRQASDTSGRGIGVLVDLQGPKIRLGTFVGGSAELTRGDAFVITTAQVEGDKHQAATTYEGLPYDVDPGDRVLVDDGKVALDVVKVEGPRVHTRVLVGGEVSDHKGLNLPGLRLSTPTLTEKDEADLRWALGLRADFVALSFVRQPEDVEPVRAVMDEVGVGLPVLAKLEKPQAVERLEEVVDAFDGLMVARGDLGVEMPLEEVPTVQKRAIEVARDRAKPVIVATQMLESMITELRPTRAETSDVANAVLDGADALMLSAETSIGDHPIETVETMARVISAAEHATLHSAPAPTYVPHTTSGAIAGAAVEVGASVDAKALAAFTQTGTTARHLARCRSSIPLLAFTTVQAVRSQLALTWGVETFLVDAVAHTDDMVRQVDAALPATRRVRQGDPVVIVAGSPPGVPGSTNMLRVHRIGETADCQE